ncbi:MAG: SDR family oxidoreductase, partial [Elusimicrobia bacterium]|nr:SDR family oxidoreductase [Elusimicrobiota bacterium]
LIGLTKSAAKELGRFNVRVNAVLPGFHLTEMGSEVGDERVEGIRREHCLERLPNTEELAGFVVSLSKLASVSGQVFNFDSRIV